MIFSSIFLKSVVKCDKWDKNIFLKTSFFSNTSLFHILYISSVQSLSHVWLFATPWTAAHQANLSITNSQSLLKLMSIESVTLSNDLILCHPLLLCLSQHQGLFQCQSFTSGGQSIGASASALALPMNIQD